jgi:ribosomal protein S18 acetylase RimI-like enzyme
MTDVVPAIDPATIAGLIEANINDYLLSYARLPGALLHDDDESQWVEAQVAGATFNSIVYARFRPEHLDRQIEMVLEHFREQAVPVVWHVGPRSEPAELGAALLRHGLRFDEEEPGMALDIAAMNSAIVAPPELTIEPVRDEAGLRDWIDTWLFPVPESERDAQFQARRTLWLEPERPLHCFLGRWNGTPVATSMLYLGHGVAAVHHVATRTEYRRRGIGSALTVRVLHEAQARGYRVGVLTASPEGHGSYYRIGFRPYCSVRRYEWEPANQP